MSGRLLDWIIEGAEVGVGHPDYAGLRSAVEAYLRTRLGEFDDPPDEAPNFGPAPAKIDASEVVPAFAEPAMSPVVVGEHGALG